MISRYVYAGRRKKIFLLRMITSACAGVLFLCTPLYAGELGEKPQGVVFCIGQDARSLQDYTSAFDISPRCVMGYTSLRDLEGLTSFADRGGGLQNADFLLREYPKASLQLGLYMVGQLKNTVSGRMDKRIRRLGEWIKKTGRTVYLRIGYEFDGPQNGYDPWLYKKAFRRVVTILRAEHVDNVRFVWHSYAALPNHPVMDWYPGDAYVDWFGVSFFYPANAVYLRHFALQAQKHHKPLMIAEASPWGIPLVNTSRAWQQWFKPYFDYIRRYHVRIASYIDYDWDDIPMFRGRGWGDARLERYPGIRTLWAQQMRRFGQGP